MAGPGAVPEEAMREGKSLHRLLPIPVQLQAQPAAGAAAAGDFTTVAAAWESVHSVPITWSNCPPFPPVGTSPMPVQLQA